MSGIFDLLLAQTTGGQSSNSFWTVFLPFLGSILGGLIAWRATNKQAKSATDALRSQATEAEKAFRRQIEQLDRDFLQQQIAQLAELDRARRLQQLNEFYGPLQALRSASVQVWEKLKRIYIEVEGLEPDYHFRLVDLLPDILKKDVYRPLVEELLRIGEQTEALMRDKSGLIEGEWPESFRHYFGHIAIMRAAAAGSNPHPGQPGYMADSSFPRSLDKDIERSASAVRSKIDELSLTTDRALKALKQIGTRTP